MDLWFALGERGKYVYSDLAQSSWNRRLKNYTSNVRSIPRQRILSPLGLTTLSFQPRNKFDLGKLFRLKMIKNFVTSWFMWCAWPRCSYAGGVSGNAGIFSDATTWLWSCSCISTRVYGGRQYFDQAVVNEFTRQQFPINKNRRGLFLTSPNRSKKQSPTAKAPP